MDNFTTTMGGNPAYDLNPVNMIGTALGVHGRHLCFVTAFTGKWEAWTSEKSPNLESIFGSLEKRVEIIAYDIWKGIREN